MFKRLPPLVKMISILALLIMLAMLAGCKKEQPNPEPADLYAPVKECNLLFKENIAQGFDCVMAIGPKLVDFGFCNQLDNPYNETGNLTEDFKSLCIIKVATYQKKEEFCPYIQSDTPEKTRSYRNTCVQDVAIAKQDNQICSLVQSSDGKTGKGTNEYDFCIFKFATELGDSNSCNELQNTLMQGMCINYAKENNASNAINQTA